MIYKRKENVKKLSTKYKNSPDNYLTDIYKLGYNNDEETTVNGLGPKIMGLELDPAFYNKKNFMNLSNENFFGTYLPTAVAGASVGSGASNSAAFTGAAANPYLFTNPNLYSQQTNISK